MSRNGKRYSEKFKIDTIRLVSEEGKSIIDVSKELGVNYQTIRTWINNKKSKKISGLSEVNRLKCELKEKQKRIEYLEKSIDILKKAAALFANDKLDKYKL
jgi:transposase